MIYIICIFRYSLKDSLLRLLIRKNSEHIRPFDKISSATVEILYSRPGNWIQIPYSILTLPVMKNITEFDKSYGKNGILKNYQKVIKNFYFYYCF